MTSYVSVDMYTENLDAAVVPGVLVRVISQDGATVFGEYTSDAEGRVRALLPAPNTFEVRLYKFGYTFETKLVDLLEAPYSNTFVFKGAATTWPLATDPRLCMASGYFRDVTGAPREHQDLHFVSDFNPFVLEGAAVVSERKTVRTDEKGWVSIPLIRCAVYGVTMEGWQDQFRLITVPDRASVNLPHLLFPRVDRVEISSVPRPSVVTIRRGSTSVVPLTVWTTDYRTLDSISTDVIWTSSSDAIFVIASRDNTSLSLRGVARGSAQLLARRTPTMQGGDPPIYYPDTPLVGSSIQVNVL